MKVPEDVLNARIGQRPLCRIQGPVLLAGNNPVIVTELNGGLYGLFRACAFLCL